MDDIISPGPEEISSLITAVYSRIKTHLPVTPVLWDERCQVWLKCENKQNTGSFKWRGALSKLSLLSPGQTVITASTGNHGLGVATASALFGLKPKIFIPSSASPQKLKKLKDLGADLQLVEGDSLQAELSGKDFAAQHGLT